MKNGQFSYEGTLEVARKEMDDKQFKIVADLATACKDVKGIDR